MSRIIKANPDRIIEAAKVDARRNAHVPQASPIAGTVFTAPDLPKTCDVCQRNPQRMNSEVAECSHVDCPHRGKAWSDRPTRAKLFKGPWPKNTSEDPRPIDKELAPKKQREFSR